MRAAQEEAYAEFARANLAWLARTAAALAGSRHAGDDLAQEALVRAYVHWRRVSAADDPRAYLRRILVRCAVDATRRPSRREVPTDQLPPAGVPDTTAAHAETDVVARALATLAPRQRQCAVLRFIEDLDVRQTAQLLGVSEGTVKSSTHQALAALRTALQEQAPGTGGAPTAAPTRGRSRP